MKPTVYIAGPMSGLPDNNYPAFDAAARHLRAMGYRVENPAENPEPPCKSWQGYMRMALRQVTLVDAVVLLPGWEKSAGANLERDTALRLGLRVMQMAEVPQP